MVKKKRGRPTTGDTWIIDKAMEKLARVEAILKQGKKDKRKCPKKN